MAKTLAQIEEQIDKLREQAEQLKAREAAEVIQRIRLAIEHYGLTSRDLFGGAAAPGRATKKTAAAKKKKKTVSPIKYRDDQGHAWTGHGKRPRWFIEAMAAGKTREDLAVKS